MNPQQNMGMPQGGMQGGPPADQVMKQMRSPMNPTDIAAMGQEQPVDMQNMTLGQFLKTRGLDVNGPVSQLVQFVQQSQQNANVGNKMKAMSQASPAEDPLAGQAQAMGGPRNAMPQQGSMPRGQGGSIEDLMRMKSGM